jgi:hypothetical protein
MSRSQARYAGPLEPSEHLILVSPVLLRRECDPRGRPSAAPRRGDFGWKMGQLDEQRLEEQKVDAWHVRM